MTTITGFAVVNEDGFPVAADPFGNNVALHCMGCGSPVLAIARENQRGSSPSSPAPCPKCAAKHWVEVDERGKKLVVRKLNDK